jgi:hypothetical protein
MTIKRAAALAAVMLACAGCAGGEETFDAEDVRRAFSTQGISLWASGAEGYVNLVPYDPVPSLGPGAPPFFYVGVFDDASEARRVVSCDAEWEVVVMTVSASDGAPGSSGVPKLKSRRLRRARNVVIEYDAADRTMTRRIAAALRALETEPR